MVGAAVSAKIHAEPDLLVAEPEPEATPQERRSPLELGNSKDDMAQHLRTSPLPPAAMLVEPHRVAGGIAGFRRAYDRAFPEDAQPHRDAEVGLEGGSSVGVPYDGTVGRKG